ncbi:MAG TPA: carbohydrate porin [Polyangiaceae bacterium]|nr:carbohydrate porin [Polyangiaceae bacterium]
MRRALQLLALAGMLAISALPSRASAQTPEPAAAPGETPDSAPSETPAPAPSTPPAAAASATRAPAPEAPPRPRVGDTTTNGYFRGGFGASSQKGRQTCFQLALNGGLLSKYRLGNECEVWAEYGLHTVVYSGNDGSVGRLHFTPAAYIPTSKLGYSPTGVTSSDFGSPGTGATVAFPNLYADIQGIPWLAGGTPWIGTRYYKRESIYISDFFYWNPSGVGGGIEDIHLGSDLRLSYAAFAVDGQPSGSPQVPSPIDLGIRNDLQLRGIRPYPSGEFQIGLQYIADFSNDHDVNGVSTTHGGWGVTLRHVQQLLGGDNKVVVQYGRGGGTGFGTLARFYYPDFSLKWDPKQARLRLLDVLTIQPLDWLGAQAAAVYERDDDGTGVSGAITTWISAGARVSVAPVDHFKILAEGGYDQVNKTNGAPTQYLAKLTVAPTISAGKELMSRPELRVFATYARWSESARLAVIDSTRIYTDNYPTYLSGWSYGLQGEAWW